MPEELRVVERQDQAAGVPGVPGVDGGEIGEQRHQVLLGPRELVRPHHPSAELAAVRRAQVTPDPFPPTRRRLKISPLVPFALTPNDDYGDS